MLALFSIAFSSAQDVRYFKLTRKVENGQSSTNVSGGQFITFTSDICFESNNHGVGVNHGTLRRNSLYSNSEYSTYQGSSYWGKNTTFKFNSDKSVLNVVLENGDVYVYKHATAPAGQETCSLIREKAPSDNNNNGGFVGGFPPQPIYYPDQPYTVPQQGGIDIGTNGSNSNTESNTVSQPKRHQCGLCGGSGRVVETKGVPSFGNTKWCRECGKYVPDNHYHTLCPSCKGKGWW